MALTDEAIEKIKQMIVSGRVRPGEKLPREVEAIVHISGIESWLRLALAD